MFSFGKPDNKREIVPEKLSEKIDFKVFLIILGGLGLYQFYLYSSTIPNDPQIVLAETLVTTATSSLAAFFGFLVSRRYWKSKVFGLSYLGLGGGMLCNAVAQIIYYYLGQTGQVQSPSIADVIWLAYYPLALFHLSRNIHFFKAKIKLPMKLFIVLLPISITGVYAILEFGETQTADLNYFIGIAYAAGGSVILSASILGAKIFRQGTLGTPWLLLALGIFLNSLGDNWYSYAALYNQYDVKHPINLLWIGGYLVIAYALHKHRRAI